MAEEGQLAEVELDIHPHMRKHSGACYLANRGYDTRLIRDYMGHKQIQNTVRYGATNASDSRLYGGRNSQICCAPLYRFRGR